MTTTVDESLKNNHLRYKEGYISETRYSINMVYLLRQKLYILQNKKKEYNEKGWSTLGINNEIHETINLINMER